MLRNIKLFRLNFSNELLDAVALSMKEILYAPGEIIFEKN